ncbi:leucyl/phenylalanyl-tRNA--protein transferase [Alkalispirochaeta sphaeroplastigenens]|uniref:Leucyl/phenylalanyl-tRNA--protein transferase n=1 Tax=Alkalispirochaeta sphaeroplastigenens TaxID=1187066 RepID=A0A2S4JUV7_9SPIO|nr:leucyl/phenylalanyl-tRNA--protein transferase [Alkalispirochaeta sphaeroplastigenens]POR03305.1 leucyl/phenylalanyl-tRNA--protein transferase [Alkalispirochaeta sphaeroplastigenens]
MEHLDEDHRIPFPDPSRADRWGLLAAGGNLSPGFLLSAYEQGVFPWYEEEPILWFSPDPRFLLFFKDLHVGKRLGRTLTQSSWQITFDQNFPGVIQACSEPRRGEGGTWITREMRAAYGELHRLGYAHSVEVWQGDSLAGGLYGVSLGGCFSGESMFSRERDASKAALVALAGVLSQWEVAFIDCQMETAHLAAFGAAPVPRQVFLELLREARGRADGAPRGSWSSCDGPSALARGIALARAADASRLSNESRSPQ